MQRTWRKKHHKKKNTDLGDQRITPSWEMLFLGCRERWRGGGGTQNTDLGVLVLVGVPSGLHRGLVVALDLAGVGVERDASGGHGDLQAPFAAAGLGQLVSSAHSVHVLLRRSEES